MVNGFAPLPIAIGIGRGGRGRGRYFDEVRGKRQNKPPQAPEGDVKRVPINQNVPFS